jgi:hypothetical protein
MTINEKEASPRQVAASGTMKHQQMLSSDKELHELLAILGQPQQQQLTIKKMEDGSGLLHQDNDEEARSTTNAKRVLLMPQWKNSICQRALSLCS